jgi:hypothetical protein
MKVDGVTHADLILRRRAQERVPSRRGYDARARSFRLAEKHAIDAPVHGLPLRNRYGMIAATEIKAAIERGDREAFNEAGSFRRVRHDAGDIGHSRLCAG